jgi:hypothetical protein
LHPVRLRVVEAFLGRANHTIADLRAEPTDVPPATHFRQVAVLAEHGVLRPVSERRVRGVDERTYQLEEAVASIDAATAAAWTRRGAPQSLPHIRTIWPCCAGRASTARSAYGAIEDCRNMTRRLEQDLLAAGERIVRVPPKLMAHTVPPPVACLDGPDREVRLLVDHRETSSPNAPAPSIASAGTCTNSTPTGIHPPDHWTGRGPSSASAIASPICPEPSPASPLRSPNGADN